MDLSVPQFAWTTFCETGATATSTARTPRTSSRAATSSSRQPEHVPRPPQQRADAVGLHDLLDQYPNGGDLPVAINDDNGNLVGFWIWHLDTANSDCNGHDGEQLRAGSSRHHLDPAPRRSMRAARVHIRPTRRAAGRVAPSVSIARGRINHESRVSGDTRLSISRSGEVQASSGAVSTVADTAACRGRASPDDPERVPDQEAGRGDPDDRADDRADAEDLGEERPGIPAGVEPQERGGDALGHGQRITRA